MTPTKLTTKSSSRWSLLVTTLLSASLFFSALGCGGGHVEPQTTPAQLDFGVEMAQRGLWSEALFRFRRAYELNPNDAHILNNMAVAYEALGRFDKALSSYQEAIRVDPTNRDLKRNYSRFVEFYRAFKPDDAAKDADSTADRRPTEEAGSETGSETGRETGGDPGEQG